MPYESRADSVMYRQVLAEAARRPGLGRPPLRRPDVEDQAAGILAGRADEVLDGPRAALGPPWTKDHRMALAATVVGCAPGAGTGVMRR